MSWIAICLSLALCQDPEPAERGRLDVVTLKSGGRLEGRILEETPSFLRIRLDEGTVVGFEKKRLSTIARAAGPVAGEPVTAALEPRDQWFVLHDGEGRAVGWLHATVTANAKGQIRLGEEWQFHQGRETTEVTVLEVANRDLTPQTCFYHERTRLPDQRIVRERVVQGTVEGERLIVDTRAAGRRQRHTYPFPVGSTFSLLAIEALRQDPEAAGLGVGHRLFDAASAELVSRLFSTHRWRRTKWNGKVVTVRELVTSYGAATNTEWLDASSGTMRREVNGPSLVALPVDAPRARRSAKYARSVGGNSFRAEQDKKFGMWLPNPAWQFHGEPETGRVSARAELEGANALLLRLDHVDGDLLLDSVADSVHRWLSLVTPGFALEDRERTRLRDREAVLLRGAYYIGKSSSPKRQQCEVYVFRVDGKAMALSLAAPEEGFERMRPDFVRIREAVELHPQSVEPVLQGPLVKR